MTATQRILFVDDDALNLMLTRRELRSMQGDWEMVFAESGAEGLSLLASKPFDVVVSDLRMPGMNGAEFLAEVMRLHPETIRLVLSSEIDPQLTLECVGCAHQFLSKPCEADTLQASLRRLSTQAGSINNEALRRLITSLDDTPTVPTLYAEIVELLQKPETSLEDVGRLVARDPAITAKLLKLTNSAFFGLRRELLDPVEAVAFLGVEIVTSLVLVFQVFSQHENRDLGGFSIEALWTHSLDTAALARSIAVAEGAESKVVNAACVSGLLHDVGKLVLAANAGELYRQVLERTRAGTAAPLAIEREIMGATHADVGGYLLGLWGLPVPVVDAIALHHAPRDVGTSGFNAVLAVHVADALVHARSHHGAEPSAVPLDTAWIEELGLTDRLDSWTKLE